jgi:Rrf2 family protein
MIFSKTTGYGIRAISYLAGRTEKGPCGLKEIADHENIPPVYLRKVLGELRRHRVLRSVKGIHGGYELARAPQNITLWDVFQVLEPDPFWDACILGRGFCDAGSPCALHNGWLKTRQELTDLLQNKTIADLASFDSAFEPAGAASSATSLNAGATIDPLAGVE